MKGTIGQLDYDDCHMCIHAEEDGSCCDVSENEFIGNVTVGLDLVYCGCFKERTKEIKYCLT